MVLTLCPWRIHRNCCC